MSVTEETMLERRAIEWICTAEEYHRDTTRIGHSLKEAFRRRPLKYWANYVAKTLPLDPPTEALILGTWTHLAVLEQAEWAKVCIWPSIDRRTKPGKQAAKELEARIAAGERFIEADLHAQVMAMREAIFGHELARALLEADGHEEHAVCWSCGETGLPLKSRRDKVTDRFVVDIKTTKEFDIGGFGRSAGKLGYHRQAAHYLDGEHEYSGEAKDFLFIAVCSSPPYEVGVYQVLEEEIKLGHAQNMAAHARLASAMATGNWRGAIASEPQPLVITKYEFYEE